jgi:hypothetical protein
LRTQKVKILKEARKSIIQGLIGQHEADPVGDFDKLDALIKYPDKGPGAGRGSPEYAIYIEKSSIH